jgi:hypothetical protein
MKPHNPQSTCGLLTPLAIVTAWLMLSWAWLTTDELCGGHRNYLRRAWFSGRCRRADAACPHCLGRMQAQFDAIAEFDAMRDRNDHDCFNTQPQTKETK